jgi:hypothetical protein
VSGWDRKAEKKTEGAKRQRDKRESYNNGGMEANLGIPSTSSLAMYVHADPIA